MNFGKSFTYIFEDPDWFSKLWKPVLCGLIPIVGQFVLQGYILNVTKNVIQGHQHPLHEMDFGEDLSAGWRLFLVQLVYALPFVILFGILFAILIPVLYGGTSNGDFESSVRVGGIVAQLIISLLSFLVSIVYFLIFPVITAHVAVKGSFKAGFEFKEMFAIVKRNIASWLMVLGGSLLASFIAPAGAIVFFIGVIVTAAYASLIVAHLQGQAYRESTIGIQPQQPIYPGY